MWVVIAKKVIMSLLGDWLIDLAAEKLAEKKIISKQDAEQAALIAERAAKQLLDTELTKFDKVDYQRVIDKIKLID